MGLPVAGLGVAGYLLMAALSIIALVSRLIRKPMGWLLLLLAIGALAFSLWLTWIELYVLGAVCPLCVLSLTLIAGISLLALLAVLLISKKESIGNSERSSRPA